MSNNTEVTFSTKHHIDNELCLSDVAGSSLYKLSEFTDITEQRSSNDRKCPRRNYITRCPTLIQNS